MTRAISTLPDSLNWDYLLERVRRYNEKPSDDLLYRIGTHVNILTLEDQDLIERNQGCCLRACFQRIIKFALVIYPNDAT